MSDPHAAVPPPPGLLAGAIRNRASIAAVARLMIRGPFGRPPTEAPALDALPVARTGPLVPDGARLRQLVVCTGGALADFERPQGLLLPPTAYVTWLTPIMSRALLGAGLALPTARVLHAGNEVRFERVPLASEPLSVEARLASIDATPARTILVERAEHRDAQGKLAFTVDTTLFFPGAKPPAPKDEAERAREKERKERERALARGEETPPRTPPAEGSAPRVPQGAREVARFRADMAASRAYTAVSGDYNPVHISHLAARLLVGAKGAFVHGYATKARVAHKVVRELLHGDPTRLRRLAVRFRKTIALDEDAGLYAVPAPEGTKAELFVGAGPGEVAAVTGEAEWVA